jgi:hypothetical protein
MLVGLLRHRSIGLSHEAKFFLLRFLQEEQKKQFDTLATLNVREMAKRIGVTPKVAGLAIEQLVSLGVLTKQSKLRQLGRPSSEYRSATEALEKLLGTSVGSSNQEPRVTRLLSEATQQTENRLMYANRLLLAVLVVHADEFGVVRHLGWRDLCQLTGLHKTAVRQRLGLLLAQHYLRAVVPGATGGALFKKVKSEYIINLSHPALLMDNSPGFLVVRTAQSRFVEEYPARLILDSVMTGRKDQPVTIGSRSYDRCLLFGGGEALHLAPLLQATIDRYASYLLSSQSQPQVFDEDGDLCSKLKDRIQSDFAVKGADQNEATDAMQEQVVQLLFEQSVTWAQKVREEISQVVNLPSGLFRYWLLPPVKICRARKSVVPQALSLLVMGSAESPQGIFRVWDTFMGVDLTSVCRAEVGLVDAFHYGLLTRPKPKPKPKPKPNKVSERRRD